MAVERWTEEMLDRFASEMNQGFSELRRDLSQLRESIQELREGQAMMMMQFTERDARVEQMRIESERKFLATSQQILELRQDFLNHVRASHPSN
ncbi:MAG: hypothetical protein HC921_15750 [Synechococcaceae cyanobacterium SM2_3_1]|nr:hypothetical protein [Synechococcaceae cyanobacterium SM2_3_1]